MKLKAILAGVAILIVTARSGFSFEPLTDVLTDSALTREEALKDLDPQCPAEIRKNQILIDVTYFGTDGRVHRGGIVADRRLAGDLKTVFEVAYAAKFPFQSVIPVSEFRWNDDASMAANNTSGFNFRPTTGGQSLSNHAYGFAVDINPLFNPYIKGDMVLPPGSRYDPSVPGTLTEDHIIVRTFLNLGWTWGGHWTSLKDYQHFEKIPE